MEKAKRKTHQSRIPWDEIEIDYREHGCTIPQLRDKYSVTYNAIANRIKKYDWRQDITRAIEHATRVAMIEEARIRAEVADGEISGQVDVGVRAGITSVDAAVKQRVAVLTRHQAITDELLASIMEHHAELAELSRGRHTMERIAEMIAEQDPRAARDIALMCNVGERIKAQRNIVDAACKMIVENRRAYGIKADAEDETKGKTEMDDLLARINEISDDQDRAP